MQFSFESNFFPMCFVKPFTTPLNYNGAFLIKPKSAHFVFPPSSKAASKSKFAAIFIPKHQAWQLAKKHSKQNKKDELLFIGWTNGQII